MTTPRSRLPRFASQLRATQHANHSAQATATRVHAARDAFEHAESDPSAPARPRRATCRHLPLASLILLATVLASRPVYALAPPATAATDATQPAPTAAPTPAKAKAAPTPVQGDATVQADAQGRTATKASKGTKSPKGATKASAKKPAAGGKKAISIDDEFLIEGKLEKPNAYYILRRSSIDFDWARLGATFSPLVLESVQDPLF